MYQQESILCHKLGLKIAKAYPTLSFADYTKEKRPESQWLRFVEDVRSQVLKQVPLVATADGFLIKQHWTDAPNSVKANVTQVLVVMWPELDLFINHWIVKALALLAINAKNRKNRSRGKQIRASIAQMISAGFLRMYLPFYRADFHSNELIILYRIFTESQQLQRLLLLALPSQPLHPLRTLAPLSLPKARRNSRRKRKNPRLLPPLRYSTF